MSSNWDWGKVFTVAATGAVAALGGYFASTKNNSSSDLTEEKDRSLTVVPAIRKPKKPQMRLFHSFPLKSTRCVWLVLELDAEADVQVVHINRGRNSESAFNQYRQEIHPHGSVPALCINDAFSILESTAVCLYLADLYTRLVPWIQNRAEYYNWINYCSVIIDPVLDRLHEQLNRTDPEYQDKPLTEELLHKWQICAKTLSDRLRGRKYICGNKFTAADCVLGYSIWWASLINKGQLLKDHPILIGYLIRMKNRAAFKETFNIIDR